MTMKNKINILVVPAGSGMAVMAIKALRQDNDFIISSADSEYLAPGLYLSHKGHIIPRFDHPDFFESIKDIVTKDHIDIVIPALDTILLAFSQRKKNFEKVGARIQISPPETIKITRDKWETYKRLKYHIPLPRSFIRKEDVDIQYPVFIKPRDGSGSKNAYMISNDKELDFFYGYIPNPIIQEFLGGLEYNVECMADNNGNLLLCMPRERREARAAMCTKSLIVHHSELEKMAERIAKELTFNGPFFFQAIEDSNGIARLSEINARVAGAMCPGSFKNGNMHTIAARLCLGENIETPEIRYGIYHTRYWDEIYLDESELIR
jgi:carbamoyl-phosphate synthase large subunit